MRRLSLHPYALPWKRAPRAELDARRGVLLRLEDDAGRVGWGDVAPWPGFGTGWPAVDRALGRLQQTAPGTAYKTLPSWPIEIQHGLDMARHDVLAQAAEQSLAMYLGQQLGGEAGHVVPVAHLIGDTDEVIPLREAGVQVFKMKIGGRPWQQDLKRVEALREASGPEAELRLDANGLFTLDEAQRLFEALAPFNIRFCEDPIAPKDFTGMAKLRHESDIAIAADMSVQSAADVRAVQEAHAADAVVLKPMFAGTFEACVEVARAAHAANLTLLLSHACDSLVGRTAAAHIAAALQGQGLLRDACGLGDVFGADVGRGPQPSGATLVLPKTPGLGVEVTR